MNLSCRIFGELQTAIFPLEILEMVHDAMDAGAAGITIGRNIWGHSNVAGITSALAEIIHNDASVENAYKLIK